MGPDEFFGALLTAAGRQDPYSLYTAVREHGPVTASDQHPTFLCGGYPEVDAVLRDKAFGVREPSADLRGPLPEGASEHDTTPSMLFIDPPDHRRLRSLVSSVFTPRRVADLEPAVVRMTEALLNRLERLGAGGEPVDFMEQVAFRMPVDVICELLGVPEADRHGFRPLAHALTVALEPGNGAREIEVSDAAALELAGYFAELAERRRREPRGDLVSALVQVGDARDGRLTDAELLANLILLLVAGFETTANLLGNGLQLGFEHPEFVERVRKGAIPVGAFVDEVLRYDSPAQITSRYALTDGAAIGGRPIPKDGRVFLLIGSANRDPWRFADPDAFDPTRLDNAPLSFGAGIHHCLGHGLARLEARTVFNRLFSRFPEIAPAGTPERRDRLALRGYATLPVRLEGGVR